MKSNHKCKWDCSKSIFFFNWNTIFCVLYLAEDGRVTYKIKFEDKSRSLVSGYHMTFEWRPRRIQLKVGTRVVIECKDPDYSPGFLAERPSWKNRMRFVPKTETLNTKDFHISLPKIYPSSSVHVMMQYVLIFRFLVFLDNHTLH